MVGRAWQTERAMFFILFESEIWIRKSCPLDPERVNTLLSFITTVIALKVFPPTLE
jgi:hypothetical protein